MKIVSGFLKLIINDLVVERDEREYIKARSTQGFSFFMKIFHLQRKKIIKRDYYYFTATDGRVYHSCLCVCECFLFCSFIIVYRRSTY